MFFCQNCGPPAMKFKNFLKRQDPLLYKEYIYSNFKDVDTEPKKKEEVLHPSKKPNFVKNIESDKIPSYVLAYIKDRHLNANDFGYSAGFYSYINKLKPGSFDVKMVKKYDHERLLIKFYDKDKRVTIIQGRALNGEEPKYITVKIDDDAEKVYGMDKVKLNEPIFVVEGVPDAMSVDNAVALLDMNYIRAARFLPRDKLIIVPDADVRNKQVMKAVDTCVKNGLAVSLLPVDGMKDLNEKLKNGMSKNEIRNLVMKYTYRGLTLKMKFSQWRKDK